MWSFSLLFLLLQRMRHWKKAPSVSPSKQRAFSCRRSLHPAIQGNKALTSYRALPRGLGVPAGLWPRPFYFFSLTILHTSPSFSNPTALSTSPCAFYFSQCLKKYKHRGRKKGMVIFTPSQHEETDFWLKAKMLSYNAVLELNPTQSCIA